MTEAHPFGNGNGNGNGNGVVVPLVQDVEQAEAAVAATLARPS